MALDMAAAYPAEAGVQTCTRRMTLADGCFTLRDAIALEKAQPVTWVLMLRPAPTLPPGGCIMADGFRIRWAEGLTAAVEPIEITDGRMKNSYPGTLWWLMLTAAPAEKHAQEFVFEE